MGLSIAAGSTNVTVFFWLRDTTSAAGAGLAGVVFNASGLDCFYVRERAESQELTLANVAVDGAHTDGGFIQVDATNLPGLYRLDLSDAIIASGVDRVNVYLHGAANMAETTLEITIAAVVAPTVAAVRIRTPRKRYRQDQAFGRPFKLNRKSPQAAGLVGWWPTLGQTGDNIRNEIDGVGTLNFINTPGWITQSEMGRVLNYDQADSDHLQSDVAITEFLDGGPFTVSMWFFQTYSIWSNLTGQTGGIDWRVAVHGATGNVSISTSGLSDTIIESSGAFPQDTLHHFAFTYGGGSKIIYKNGLNIAQEDGITGIVSFGGDIFVGCRNGPQEFFGGWIGDFRIYNCGFSPSEVYQLYAPQTRWDLYAPRPRVFPIELPPAAGITINANVGVITATGQIATIDVPNIISATAAGIVTATGQQVAIDVPNIVSANPGIITATGQTATIDVAGVALFSIRAVRQAVNTATGNQDFNVSGWTTTPQAALYFATYATADNSAVDHAVLGIGLATSTSQRHTGGIRDEHGVGTTDTSRRTISDECIVILDPADGSVDGEADFVQFNTGGSRVNWGAAPDSAYLMTALYFAGFDNVDLRKVDAATSQTVTIGFEADIVILVSTNGANSDTVHVNSELGMGIAVNGGGQGHVIGYSADGQGESANRRGISNNKIWGGSSGADWLYTIAISSFTSTGFDLDVSTGAIDATDDWFVLSLELPSGLSAWCGGIASPTSPGDDAQTGPGFKPQALIGLLSDVDTFNSWENSTADAGAWAVTAATDSEQFCHCVACENGVIVTMDTESLVDNQLVHLHSDDGSNQLEATLASFDTLGWTPNYSVVDNGTARQQFWLAIEEEAADERVISPVNVMERLFAPRSRL